MVIWMVDLVLNVVKRTGGIEARQCRTLQLLQEEAACMWESQVGLGSRGSWMVVVWPRVSVIPGKQTLRHV